MSSNRKLTLDGYEFELTGFFCEEGTTTITMNVSGNGQSPSDLKGWVLEVCPGDPQRFTEDVSILSCEKRRRHGGWSPAVAYKTSYELTGDIGVTGVVISDWIGRYQDDPDVEYRVVLDKELAFEPVSVGIVFADETRISEEKISLRSRPQTRQWKTPIEKEFCLYVALPEGYEPVSVRRVSISITKGQLFIADIKDGEQKPVRAELVGAVRIMASVPLKSEEACGDEVYASAHDCFEVRETLGYADAGERFDLSELTVRALPESLDLTMLSACYGSVYRLDGKYIIDK